jgi:ariadne-1
MVSDVEKLCGGKTAGEFAGRIAAQHVDVDDHIKYCRIPGCNRLVTRAVVGLCGIAVCGCGAAMCWHCGEESHAPLQCSRLARWGELTDDQTLWRHCAVTTTRPCPACNARIEKNGGCNHMTCRCGNQFCWVCGQPWANHGTESKNCNPEKLQDALQQTGLLEPADFKRLADIHFAYLNAKLANETERTADGELREKLINAVRETRSNEIDDALRILEGARSVLQWAHPHRFFLGEGSTQSKLFDEVWKPAQDAKAEFVALMISDRIIEREEFQMAVARLDGKIRDVLTVASSSFE